MIKNEDLNQEKVNKKIPSLGNFNIEGKNIGNMSVGNTNNGVCSCHEWKQCSKKNNHFEEMETRKK